MMSTPASGWQRRAGETMTLLGWSAGVHFSEAKNGLYPRMPMVGIVEGTDIGPFCTLGVAVYAVTVVVYHSLR